MMTKAIAFSCILLMCISLPVSTNAYPKGYIGLYADDSHDTWCAMIGAPIYPLTMWVWCLPSDNGMICAEFLVEFPSNVMASSIEYNPLIPPLIVPLPSGGHSLCMMECQWDWIWMYRQQLYVTDTERSVIRIVALPEAGAYQFASCLPGYPIEPCTRLTNLYINYEETEPECQGTPVSGTSWGAIKSLVE